ncbi:hypothetical protein EGX98_02930 [Fusobacterium necrophorum]|uniref:hypothetical protein n=1 Tax=Fusobacterium necrophorum TaxID=859 RepID=UPI00088EB40D|nr:hypothetical protein [Fusobacterium necrophorum]AYZ73094.1 hypothetical protein EGX98_02930 [Fusobacterium necrophorum]AZW08909.1 hypothetical protein EO219_04480 [Fusobacterium necrophorum subsp. necrophorum]SDB28543.1 hypothetical protein SAMN02983009_01378 [Fusobacterium necrophorum]SQD09880.1 Uncharacterised protein [Fusobacterium necrophorum subsp. necrophorum]
MKKGKKIILFLVEGASDCTSLEFIEHLSNNEKIKFQITEGDITSRKGVNLQNCIVKVNNHVMDFIKRNKLKKTDIFQIIHVLDIDGVYIPDANITEDRKVKKYLYSTKGITYYSKNIVQTRNKSKRGVLEKLLSTSSINSIPYRLYYMSCNLEHVLHNRLEDIKEEEKNELANQFADKFYEKEIEFIKFINDPIFKVPGNYNSTWEFIKKGLNSVNRYSNLWLFFEGIYEQ